MTSVNSEVNPKLVFAKWFACAVTTVPAIVLCVLYAVFGLPVLKTLAVTFVVVAFNCDARILLGWLVPKIAPHVNFERGCFRIKPFEKKIFEVLRVRSWKNHMPTYLPGAFNPFDRSLAEVRFNMLTAECVHMSCALVSYVPMFLIFVFGCPVVFIMTSVAGSLIDLMFVTVQRFNRSRLEKII